MPRVKQICCSESFGGISYYLVAHLSRPVGAGYVGEPLLHSIANCFEYLEFTSALQAVLLAP